MKAVIYARYSSDNQREESIDAQVRACQAYCARQGIDVVGVYVDQALTATSDSRPDFQRMVRESAGAEWNAVVVHKLDRFARNRYDSVTYKRRLRLNGVRVISVLENIDATAEGSMLEAVLEGMAEYFSKNLSREVKKGQKENVLQKRTTGGLPPLGYDVDDEKRFVINENEARAVQLIFLWYLKGMGYKAIAKQLDAMGIKSKRGNSFSPVSIHDILKNEKYKGVLVSGKYARDEEGKFDRHSDGDADSVTRIEGGVPAIVPVEQWEEANRNMSSQTLTGRTHATHTYLLSGLIFCGSCGSPMGGHRSRNYTAYRCGGRHGAERCTMPDISTARVDNKVLEALRAHILGPDAINHLVPEMARIAHERGAEALLDYQAVKDGLTELDRQINSVVDAITAIGGSPALLAKLKDLEEKKRDSLNALVEVELDAQRYNVDAGGLRDVLERDAAIIESGNAEQMVQVIQRYVRRVTVRMIDGGPGRDREIDVELIIPQGIKS